MDRQSLGFLLAQLNNEHTILWVIGPLNSETAQTAGVLAEGRDSLRQAGTGVVALYTGPTSHWQPALLPLLRTSRANFVCAVVAPQALASFASWLGGEGGRLPPGLYVLDPKQRVVGRLACDPRTVAEMIAALPDDKGVLLSNAPPKAPSLRARVRVLEVSTGQMLASATSDAADLAGLAVDLAHQLSASAQPPGQSAFFPFRELGSAFPSVRVTGVSLSTELAKQLSGAGWPPTVAPQAVKKTCEALGLGLLEVEFEPTRLAGRTSWDAIVVGTISVVGQAAVSRTGQASPPGDGSPSIAGRGNTD